MEISQAFSPSRAIAHGLAALTRAPLSVLVGGFLMFLIGMCSGGGGSGGDLGQLAEDQPPEVSVAILLLVLSMLAVGLVVGLVAFVARCFLLPGWIRVQRHVLEHGSDNLALLFSGGDATLRMIGWQLLEGFIRFGTLAVSAIPGAIPLALAFREGGEPDLALFGAGVVLILLIALPVSIYVGLGLRLGSHAVTLEGLGPMAALDRSWELARGNRLTLWIFFLITDLFSALGLLLCFIGVFVTRAVADVGVTESYLLATVPEAKDWEIPKAEGL